MSPIQNRSGVLSSPPPVPLQMQAAAESESLQLPVTVDHFTDPTRLRIEGRGKIEIDATGITLTAGIPGSGFIWLLNKPLQKRFATEQIVDVAQDGRRIGLAVHAQGRPIASVGFRARTAAEAALIASRLPSVTTPQFVQDRRRQQAFDTALAAATPTAWVTPALVGLNVAVFAIMGLSGAGWFSPDTSTLVHWGANFWPLTTSGQWWRLITCAFVHAGLLHLLFNMWALWMAGVLVEKLYGNGFYAAVYFLGAAGAGLASIAAHRDSACIGASGAVFAVYGALVAYLVFHPKTLPRRGTLPLLKSALGFIAYNVCYGAVTPHIDNAAHLGGLAAGLLLGAIFARPLAAERRRRQTRPRSWTGAGFALVATIVVLLYLPRVERAEPVLDSELAALTPLVARSNTTYNLLLGRWKEQKLSDAQFAAELRRQVWPDVDQTARRLEHIDLSPASPRRRQLDLLRDYARARRDGLHLFTRSLESQDQDTARRGAELLKHAEEVAGQVEKLSEASAPR